MSSGRNNCSRLRVGLRFWLIFASFILLLLGAKADVSNCILSFVSPNNISCDSKDDAGAPFAARLTRALFECGSNLSAGPLPQLRVVLPTDFAAWLRPALQRFKALYGFPLQVDELPAQQVVALAKKATSQRVSSAPPAASVQPDEPSESSRPFEASQQPSQLPQALPSRRRLQLPHRRQQQQQDGQADAIHQGPPGLRAAVDGPVQRQPQATQRRVLEEEEEEEEEEEGALAGGDAASDAVAAYDVWLHPSGVTLQLAAAGMLSDMSHLVELVDRRLAWQGIHQNLRLQLATYSGETVGVPLDGTTFVLMYDRDVVTDMGATVPSSWAQLVHFITTYQQWRRQQRLLHQQEGQAGQGGGDEHPKPPPEYPLCLPRGAGCTQVPYLQAIWSSISQTHGSQQGVHFDPATLQPLLDTPAAREAFRLLAAMLAAAAPPEPDEGCSHGSLAFARGRCALVLAGFVPQLSLLTNLAAAAASSGLGEGSALASTSTFVMSQRSVGVAPQPGSQLVWERGPPGDRSGGSLVPCHPDLCPHAAVLEAEAPPASSGGAGGNHTTSLGGSSGGVLVNHAPQLSEALLVGGIGSRSSAIVKLMSYQLLAYLASPDRFDFDIETAATVAAAATTTAPLPPYVSPTVTVTPVRMSYLSADADLTPWTQAEYDEDLVRRALPVLAAAVKHPNLSPGLRMTRSAFYQSLLEGIIGGLQTGRIVVPPTSDAPQPNGSSPSAQSGQQYRRGLLAAWRQQRQLLAGRQLHGTAVEAAEPAGGGRGVAKEDTDRGVYEGLAQAVRRSLGGGEAAAPAGQTQSLQEALADAQAAAAKYYTPGEYLLPYIASLQPQHPPKPMTDAYAESGGSNGRCGVVVTAVATTVTVVSCGLIVAAVSYMLLSRNDRMRLLRRRLKRLLGPLGARLSSRRDAPPDMSLSHHVTAPVACSETAILVTDIQSSTTLWEVLPANAMSAAVQLHHVCIRRLLVEHSGYESATEGDSFILAFRTVKQAVAFAMDLQAQLLVLPWPEELLEHEICAPVYTDLPDGFPFAHHEPDEVDPAGAGLVPPSRPRSRAALTAPSPPITAAVSTFRARSRNRILGGGGCGGSTGALSGTVSVGSVGGIPSPCNMSISMAPDAVVTAAAALAISPRSTGSVSAATPPAALLKRRGESSSFSRLFCRGRSPLAMPARSLSNAAMPLPADLRRKRSDCPSPPRPSPRASARLYDTSSAGGGGDGNGSSCGRSYSHSRSGEHSSSSLRSVLFAAAARAVAAAESALSASGRRGRRQRTRLMRGSLPPQSFRPIDPYAPDLAGADGAANSVGASGGVVGDVNGDVEIGDTSGHARTTACVHPSQQRQRLSALRLDLRNTDNAESDNELLETVEVEGATAAAATAAETFIAAAAANGDGAGSEEFLMLPSGLAVSRTAPQSTGGIHRLASTGTPLHTCSSCARLSGLAAGYPAGAHGGVGAGGGGGGDGGGGLISGTAVVSPDATAAPSLLQQYGIWVPPSGRMLGQLLSELKRPGFRLGEESGRSTRRVLMFRGLRVRVGIHTGVSSEAEMQYNTAAARIVYGGPCVATCKAVADMAHGGQVFLSGAAREQLEEQVHHHKGGRPGGTLMLHMGTYTKDSAPSPAPAVVDADTAAATDVTAIPPAPTAEGADAAVAAACRALLLSIRSEALLGAVASEVEPAPLPDTPIGGGNSAAAATAAAYSSSGAGRPMSSGFAVIAEAATAAYAPMPGSPRLSIDVATTPAAPWLRPPLPPLPLQPSPPQAQLSLLPVVGRPAASACLSSTANVVSQVRSQVDLLATARTTVDVKFGSTSTRRRGDNATTGTEGAACASTPQAAAAQPPPMPVYWVTSPSLTQRMALVPPPRVPFGQVALNDVYGAPVGRVSYVYVQVPAAPTLLTWDEQVAGEALRLFVDTAQEQMRMVQGGYMSCPHPGEIYAAFTTALAAVQWAEGLRRKLLVVDWPEALLQHELCEPVDVSDSGSESESGSLSGAGSSSESVTPAGPMSATTKIQSATNMGPQSFASAVGGLGRLYGKDKDNGGGAATAACKRQASENLSWRSRLTGKLSAASHLQRSQPNSGASQNHSHGHHQHGHHQHHHGTLQSQFHHHHHHKHHHHQHHNHHNHNHYKALLARHLSSRLDLAAQSAAGGLAAWISYRLSQNPGSASASSSQNGSAASPRRFWMSTAASPPGTPVPSALTATTTAPGTTAPGTTAPGTTAPGTTAPGTTAPANTTAPASAASAASPVAYASATPTSGYFEGPAGAAALAAAAATCASSSGVFQHVPSRLGLMHRGRQATTPGLKSPVASAAASPQPYRAFAPPSHHLSLGFMSYSRIGDGDSGGDGDGQNIAGAGLAGDGGNDPATGHFNRRIDVVSECPRSGSAAGMSELTTEVPSRNDVELRSGMRALHRPLPGASPTSARTLVRQIEPHAYSESIPEQPTTFLFAQQADAESETAGAAAMVSAAHGACGADPVSGVACHDGLSSGTLGTQSSISPSQTQKLPHVMIAQDGLATMEGMEIGSARTSPGDDATDGHGVRVPSSSTAAGASFCAFPIITMPKDSQDSVSYLATTAAPGMATQGRGPGPVRQPTGTGPRSAPVQNRSDAESCGFRSGVLHHAAIATATAPDSAASMSPWPGLLQQQPPQQQQQLPRRPSRRAFLQHLLGNSALDLELKLGGAAQGCRIQELAGFLPYSLRGGGIPASCSQSAPAPIAAPPKCSAGTAPGTGDECAGYRGMERTSGAGLEATVEMEARADGVADGGAATVVIGRLSHTEEEAKDEAEGVGTAGERQDAYLSFEGFGGCCTTAGTCGADDVLADGDEAATLDEILPQRMPPRGLPCGEFGEVEAEGGSAIGGLRSGGEASGGRPSAGPGGRDVGSSVGPQRARRLLLRGLRVRAGISTGPVSWSVQDHTHDVGYTGKPVRVAFRLATSVAASGQVLCCSVTCHEAVAAQAMSGRAFTAAEGPLRIGKQLQQQQQQQQEGQDGALSALADQIPETAAAGPEASNTAQVTPAVGGGNDGQWLVAFSPLTAKASSLLTAAPGKRRKSEVYWCRMYHASDADADSIRHSFAAAVGVGTSQSQSLFGLPSSTDRPAGRTSRSLLSFPSARSCCDSPLIATDGPAPPLRRPTQDTVNSALASAAASPRAIPRCLCRRSQLLISSPSTTIDSRPGQSPRPGSGGNLSRVSAALSHASMPLPKLQPVTDDTPLRLASPQHARLSRAAVDGVMSGGIMPTLPAPTLQGHLVGTDGGRRGSGSGSAGLAGAGSQRHRTCPGNVASQGWPTPAAAVAATMAIGGTARTPGPSAPMLPASLSVSPPETRCFPSPKSAKDGHQPRTSRLSIASPSGDGRWAASAAEAGPSVAVAAYDAHTNTLTSSLTSETSSTPLIMLTGSFLRPQRPATPQQAPQQHPSSASRVGQTVPDAVTCRPASYVSSLQGRQPGVAARSPAAAGAAAASSCPRIVEIRNGSLSEPIDLASRDGQEAAPAVSLEVDPTIITLDSAGNIPVLSGSLPPPAPPPVTALGASEPLPFYELGCQPSLYTWHQTQVRCPPPASLHVGPASVTDDSGAGFLLAPGGLSGDGEKSLSFAAPHNTPDAYLPAKGSGHWHCIMALNGGNSRDRVRDDGGHSGGTRTAAAASGGSSAGGSYANGATTAATVYAGLLELWEGPHECPGSSGSGGPWLSQCRCGGGSADSTGGGEYLCSARLVPSLASEPQRAPRTPPGPSQAPPPPQQWQQPPQQPLGQQQQYSGGTGNLQCLSSDVAVQPPPTAGVLGSASGRSGEGGSSGRHVAPVRHVPRRADMSYNGAPGAEPGGAASAAAMAEGCSSLQTAAMGEEGATAVNSTSSGETEFEVTARMQISPNGRALELDRSDTIN